MIEILIYSPPELDHHATKLENLIQLLHDSRGKDIQIMNIFSNFSTKIML